MRATLLVGAAVALAAAVSLGLPSCGIMSTGNCTDKAACAPPDATDEDAGGDEAFAEAAPDVPGEEEANSALDECVPLSAIETDCNDGIDNDCNGLTDCADPNCQNYSCVAAPPNQWLGPIALWEGPLDAGGPPTCPEGYENPTDGYGALNAPPPKCACACDPPPNLACPDPMGTFYKDSLCGVPSTCVPGVAIHSSCTPIPEGGSCGNVFSLSVDALRPTGGSCTARVISPPPAPPTWTALARICTVSVTDKPGGCAGPGQCVPTPNNHFETAPCIYQILQNGETPTCPAGYPSPPRVYFFSSMPVDTRTCPCQCNPATGNCTGTIKIYNGPNCIGPALMPPYSMGMGCQPENLSGGPPPSFALGAYALADASCAPVAALPAAEGGVSGMGPAMVICCK